MNNIIRLEGSRIEPPSTPQGGTRNLSYGAGGGDDGGMSDIEARVRTLEDERRDLRADLTAVRVDVAEIKGLLRSAPSASEFGELKGRVNSLPTTAKLAAIVATIGALFQLIANWDKVSPFLKSLLGW